MADAIVEVTIDDPHLREHHREWVAALGRGWRIQRIMIPTFALVGVSLLVIDGFRWVGGFFVAVALYEQLSTWVHKARWVAVARAQPRYGARVRMEIHGGQLLQVSPVPKEELQLAEIVPSPRGLLLRLEQPFDAPNNSVSSTHASLYLPLRAFQPALTHEQIVAPTHPLTDVISADRAADAKPQQR